MLSSSYRPKQVMVQRVGPRGQTWVEVPPGADLAPRLMAEAVLQPERLEEETERAPEPLPLADVDRLEEALAALVEQVFK